MKTETKLLIILGTLATLAIGAGIAYDLGAFDDYKYGRITPMPHLHPLQAPHRR